jgi:hypothetical protein
LARGDESSTNAEHSVMTEAVAHSPPAIQRENL